MEGADVEVDEDVDEEEAVEHHVEVERRHRRARVVEPIVGDHLRHEREQQQRAAESSMDEPRAGARSGQQAFSACASPEAVPQEAGAEC